MNPSVDEVILRVESRSEAVAASFPAKNGVLPCHVLHRDSSQVRMPFPRAIDLKSNGGGNCESLERRVSEETNDAIWEETASPDVKPEELKQAAHRNSSSNNGRKPGSHLSLERMPREDDLDELRRETEPRHHSLDLDIHLNEPNLVMLQDRAYCKPLSGHLVERGFSFTPKSSGPNVQRSSSQRFLRIVSSSKPNHKLPSQLYGHDLRACPSETRAEEEEEEEGRRGTSEVASSRSQTRRKLGEGLEVRFQHVEAEAANSFRKGGNNNEEDREGAAPEARSGAEKNSKFEMSRLRTVKLSRELLKTKTKSRLIEVSFPSSPGAASVNGTDAAKKATGHPQSPPRHNVNKADDGEEEDPFKDIDLQDKFRQGNLKAITVAQWVAFFVVMGCLVCSLTVRGMKGRQMWGLELWKWFLLVLVVLCGRLVSGWLIRLLVIIFEKNFLLRKKVLYFVYGLRKGVQNCLWLGLVLLAWKLMFDPRVERSTANHKALSLVTKLFECFLIAAFIWLAKLLLVKSLASSFHVTAFFDRIQESLFNQHVLEALSGPPLLNLSFESQKPASAPVPVSLSLGRPGAGKKLDKNQAAISIGDLQKLSTQNVSAGLMKKLMNLVKHPGIGTLVTTIDESVCIEDYPDDIEINSEMQAKAAAKRIFKNVAQQDSRSIEKEDLLRFVTPEEVFNVLCLFEGAKETGKITRKALKNWVVKVYQDRRSLSQSLNDTKTAVKELHRMASVVMSIIIVVVWLLVLGIASTHVLLFVGSQLLLVGFMFGNTVKQVFEAFIFLFVMHPYDVGDRCIIDGVQMVVEEMKILSTVFLRADNEKVFYPNSVLATKPISNLYRSPDMKDVLEFSVHISTPTENITALKEKISAYVERKSEHWHPKFSVLVKELEDLNRMRLSVIMQHTINFQNFGERMSRRSDLLLELKRFFSDLGIEYRLLPQPVHLTYNFAVPTPLVATGQMMTTYQCQPF